MQDELPVWNPDLEEVSFRFFKLFSRAEYALKASGFVKRPSNSPTHNAVGETTMKAKPDWATFSRSVDASFLCAIADQPSLGDACHALFGAPPKKQTVDGSGNLRWEAMTLGQSVSADPTTNILNVLRNNLFHGGKAGPGGWDDPARTRFLLENGIIVLTALMKCDQDVWEAMVSP